MQVKVKAVGALLIALGAVGFAVPAEAAVLDRACPTGSTAQDYRALDGTNRAKMCFKGSGDVFYWKDINTDGIGAYGYAYFYSPGVSGQKWLRTNNYSGQATDTYWDYYPYNIDETRSLTIYACSQNVSEGIDYGCGSGTAVSAADR